MRPILSVLLFASLFSLRATGSSALLDTAIADAIRRDGEVEKDWLGLSTPEALSQKRSSTRQALVAAVGGFPERCDLDVRVLGAVNRDGYRIEKLLFASRPNHHVTAHLFLPRRAKAPYPAILMPCGHDDEGKLSRNHQRAAVIAAEAGFAVLLCDPLDQGERIQHACLPQGNVDGHVNAGLRAHLLGWGMAQFRIWDCRRGVDLLTQRPDIDGRRIGVAGMSGGGTLSAYLFLLDDRLQAACPMGFLTDMSSLAVGPGPQDCEQIIFGQLSFGVNHLALMAGGFPRPICPGFTYDDVFPYAGSQRTFTAARSIYGRHGFPDRIDSLTCPGKHGWYESEKVGQVLWMRRWLCGDCTALPFDRESLNALNARQDAPETDVALAGDDAGKVLPDGVMALPGERSVYDLLRDEGERLLSRRSVLTRETVRRILGEPLDVSSTIVASPALRKGYWFSRGGEDEQTAAVLAWTGRNLVANRVAELVAGAKAYRELNGGRLMTLKASGEDAVAAAHAWYLERELFAGIELDNPPPSWQELLRDPALRINFRSVVYGAFRYYDWTDLLDDSRWIRPAQEPSKDHDVAVFRRDWISTNAIRRAQWTVASLGVMRLFANGREVGAAELLKPGLTDIGRRQQSYVYDLTPFLDCRPGATNRLEAMVAASWWRDQVVNASVYPPRRHAGFKSCVSWVDEPGVRRFLPTDGCWLADYTGPVLAASIFGGERYDARVPVRVATPAVESTEFRGVVSPALGRHVVHRDDLALIPQKAWVWSGAVGAREGCQGRVRVVRNCQPGETMTLDKGETLVVDFGQNASGLPEFEFSAARGVRLVARPAEMLNDADGEECRGNDGPAGSVYRANYRAADSVVDYVFADDRRVRYAPSFTFYGGRYWSVTSDGPVAIHEFVFVPIMSIAAEDETLDFTTGRDDLNRLIDNCIWGMRSNYLSVPTDCPQRDERQGWTGDAQVYAGAAVWNADVRGFLGKWMTDLRDGVMGPAERYPGSFREVAPPGPAGCGGHRIGWSDAGIIVPYTLWRHYGETAVIRDNWAAMTGYVDLLRRTEYRTPASDYQYADWLSMEKYEQRKWFEHRQPADESEVEKRRYWDFLGAATRLQDLRMMIAMAEAVGRLESAERFRAEETECVRAFRSEFLPDGRLPECFRDMQTPALYVLSLGLVEGEAKRQTARTLVANIRNGGCRVRTGFLGTAILLETLANCLNETALAYTILLNHEFPGWLYSVDQGATTIWERWNGYTREKGFGPVGMNSFNHYAYGAVEGWMVRTMAGIRPGLRGGFSRFELRPQPDPRIGWIRTAYRSPHGLIRSDWRYGSDGVCRWTFSVPYGTTALVRLPDGSARDYGAGTYTLTLAKGDK